MRFALILITLLHTTPAQSQYESVFGAQETSWKIFKYNGDLLAPIGWYRTQITNSMNDTVVAGTVYKRYIHENNDGQIHFDMTEDTISGKIWMGFLNDTMHLKYDLSLSVGDPFYFDNPVDTGIVQNIFYQNNRKHIEFDIQHYITETPIMFIEGVGPTTGFVVNTLTQYPIELIGYLLCHEKDGITTYVNTISNNCFLNYLDTDELYSNNPIQLHPNPTRGNTFTLTLDKAIQQEDITIYDALGKQVKKFDFKSISSSSHEIILPKIQAGIYHVQINTQSGFSTEKLIVLD